MSATPSGVALLDLEPATSDFLDQAVAGLSSSPRMLPSKFFYDERGSDLFQQICELPEYYVTRTETEILRQHGAEIAESIGDNAELVGFGTGAGVKTRMVLDHLENLIAYVPVDISKQRLTESAEALSREMPALEILPVCADYLQPFELPTPSRKPAHIAVYFPGSTIGNMQPGSGAPISSLASRDFADTAAGSSLASICRNRARFWKLPTTTAPGVTARFQSQHSGARQSRTGRGLRSLRNGDIAPSIIEEAHRIEMHLISERAQTVHLGEGEFYFAPGEKIITEFSYKHTDRRLSARSPPRPVSNSRASGPIRKSFLRFSILQRSSSAG